MRVVSAEKSAEDAEVVRCPMYCRPTTDVHVLSVARGLPTEGLVYRVDVF